jgi:hypothetical protein
LAQYTANVQATSNTSTSTDDTFLEVKAAASTIIKIKRIRVGFGDGTLTAGVDNHFRIKLMRWDTTTGGTSASFTPIKKNANASAAAATVKIKSGTTALALGTTNVETVDIIGPNGRALWEWVARDDDDMIQVKAAGLFAVVIASPVASQKFSVTVEWVE